jgi:hypothetical protein
LTDFFELAGNLLTLEIDTILKDNMSAQKMPTPANAIIDVVQDYYVFLCRLAAQFGPLGNVLPPWADRISRSFDWGLQPFPLSNTPGTRASEAADGQCLQTYPGTIALRGLHAAREVAVWLQEMRDRTGLVARGQPIGEAGALPAETIQAAAQLVRAFRAEDDAVLDRVQRNCDQLKDIVGTRTIARDTTLTLAGDDVVLVRKVWELSTEVIVMQTVVQIDGDVVTRVQPGRESAQDAVLHAVHNDAVSTSFRHWSFLLRALGQLAGTTVRALLH